MSTQLFTGAIGAAIGFAIGGPTGAGYGWMIGSTIGGLYEYSQLPDSYGPRLDDLSVQQNSYGAAIPDIWGTVRVAGTMVWKTDLVQHESSQSAKGGPDIVTFTYTFSGAYVICMGPIASVTRIWANKRLIYDMRAGQTPYTDSESLGGLRIYLGTETQTADPLIEATEGSAPGYRGYAYVVFENFQLTTHYGNHPPLFEFEVVEAGRASNTITFLADSSSIWGDTVVYNAAADEIWAVSDGYSTITRWDPATGEVLGTITLPHPNGSLVAVYDWVNEKVWYYSTTGVPALGDYIMRVDAITGVVDRVFNPTADNAMVVWKALIVNAYSGKLYLFGSTTNTNIFYLDNDTGALISTISTGSPGLAPFDACFDKNGRLWIAEGSASTDIVYSIQLEANVDSGSPDDTIGTVHSYDSSSVIAGNWLYCCYDKGNNSIWFTGDQSNVEGNTVEFDLDTLTFGNAISGNGGTTVSQYNGRIVYDSVRQMIWFTENRVFADPTIYGYSTADATLQYSIDGITTVNGGLVYDPARGSLFVIGAYGSEGLIRIDVGQITSEQVSLDTIVADLCEATGLESADIDVTDLHTEQVRGYVRPRQMSARAAIEPLQAAYYFDAVESDFKLKFVKRGSASVATIPEVDRGAYVAGSDPVPALKITRTADLELPWEVEVQYPDADQDHQPGTAYARRLAGSAKTAAQFQIPVDMSNAKATEVAQTNLYAAWHRRINYEWATTRKYDSYEPTDVVMLPTATESYTVQITEKHNLGNGIIEWVGQGVDIADIPANPTQIEPTSITSTSQAVGQPTVTTESNSSSITAAFFSDNANYVQAESLLYVPSRDELWGVQDDGSGTNQIIRWSVTGSPTIVGYVTLSDLPAFPMCYDVVNDLVWAYVGSGTSSRLVKIVPSTLASTETYLGSEIETLDVDPYTGNIWVNLLSASNTLYKLDLSGSPTLSLSAAFGVQIGYRAFDSAGNLWTYQLSTGILKRVNQTTGAITSFDLAAASPTDIPAQITGLVYDSGRNSLWLHSSTSLYEWNIDTQLISQSVANASPNGGSSFARLAYDPVNALVWGTRFSDGQLMAVQTASGSLVTSGSPNQLVHPTGVTVGVPSGSPSVARQWTFDTNDLKVYELTYTP